MQTDAWLTDTSYPDRCPLCSQPLAGGSNTCLTCGFTAHEPVGNEAISTFSGAEKLRASNTHDQNKEEPPARLPGSRQPNPVTPIPPRASAQRGRSRPGVIPRRGRADAGLTPSSGSAQQGAGWQHNSSSYEAASSLSSLSLIISEAPTAPPRNQRPTRRLEHIDEIDTVPQSTGQTPALQRLSGHMQGVVPELPETPLPSGSLSLRFDDLAVSNLALILSEPAPPLQVSHVDEIDTLPEASPASSRSLVLLQTEMRNVAIDAASWSAGPDSTSSLAERFIATRSPRRRRRKRIFSPLDRTRWWLLRPGHIEFLLWTIGSVLLFGVTFLLLLATALSIMLPGLQAQGNFPVSAANVSSTTPIGTRAASNGLRLTLTGKTSLPSGAEVQIQGAGFHPHRAVVFLLDGRLALLDQHGKAAQIQTDNSGHFAMNLWLGQGPGWSPGSHQLLARETVSGAQITVGITIIAPATPVSTGTQSTSAPPSSTPVPSQPTPVRPTPTPVVPTPGVTPTAAASPAPDPTKGTATTPVASNGTPTPVQGQVDGSSSLGNSLNNANDASLFTRLAHLNPLIWLIGVCYFISMLLLGMAGLLRRKRH
ncbi:MAG TPA: hypothetical protein VGD98_12080 [Ktedonobacteraceae bacterium]